MFDLCETFSACITLIAYIFSLLCLKTYSVSFLSQNGVKGLGETFGRVTIEAMAFGLPVWLPICFHFSFNHILW